jgi:hypothetical protein
MLSALARSLGLEKSRTQALLSELLASLELDANSLLMQSHARFQKQKRWKREYEKGRPSNIVYLY